MTSSNAIDLIIWDCDGCLIDSEAIACSSAIRSLEKAGFKISLEEYIDQFAGTSMQTALARIDFLAGFSVSQTFSDDERLKHMLVSFDKALQPIHGVKEALAALPCDHCVASGSEKSRLDYTLALVDLFDFFEGRIFSTSQVARGKPAPDVFLFAAQQRGIDPSRCLVIEDSTHGIEAAQAAGMRVFGFVGASHVTPRWRQRIEAMAPDAVFDDMAQLPKLVASWSRAE